ncbi:DUF488 domain-containing protein [Oceanobacillus halotolerans]|uniref:DUF488 domain-containing protein n=1 Tax=Oceanobacillus halotolerans TaxID=2663380 RepID=UPI0013DB965A|nr:DUF488 family protein [Oceanobacillus halotolerans]
MRIKTKRIYDDVSSDDGVRILVDRLWPRGVSKQQANIDEWLKDIAPSSALRKEFNHQSERFDWFKKAYLEELQTGPQYKAFQQLKKIMLENSTVTLLYAAKDRTHNQAMVLKEQLDSN